MDKVKVLGVEMFAGTLEGLIENLLKGAGSDECATTLLVSATSSHGLVHSKKHPKFAKILRRFTLNVPDGVPITWVSRLKGYTHSKRCYGPDLFKYLMIRSADQKINHFLCGGNDGVAEKLKMSCEQKFDNKHITGIYTPPFANVEDFEYKKIAEKIMLSKADVVWIGLSTPKQEEFAYRLAKHVKVKFIITVGAAFDFHIGAVRQAPSWIQKSGMEWCFRFLMEPKRLAKRYIQVIPLFIYHNLIEVLGWDRNVNNLKESDSDLNNTIN